MEIINNKMAKNCTICKRTYDTYLKEGCDEPNCPMKENDIDKNNIQKYNDMLKLKVRDLSTFSEFELENVNPNMLANDLVIFLAQNKSISPITEDEKQTGYNFFIVKDGKINDLQKSLQTYGFKTGDTIEIVKKVVGGTNKVNGNEQQDKIENSEYIEELSIKNQIHIKNRREINNILQIEEQAKITLNSVSTSLNELREYYTINKQQASRSFTFSIIAMSIGFSLLISSIVISYFVSDNIPIATITSLSSLIMQFIGASYFYMYKNSIKQLNYFFSQLEKKQNFLLAFQSSRLCETSNQTEHLKTILEMLNKNQNSSNVMK